jgi:prepilin-type N-terminal cleavage/methylation domain-containing protein
MNVRARRPYGKTAWNTGFSMVEMMLVIGIIGVVVGAGAYSYVKSINRSRVDTAVRIVNANMVQARQIAIARRQSIRVAIDVGELDGFAEDKLVGPRTRRASIWIEAKNKQQFNFDVDIPQGTRSSDKLANAYMIGDPDYFPDSVMITDVDNRFPGLGNEPSIFYVEFSPRGAISKVYFHGQEATTTYNLIAPVIHMARESEILTLNGKEYEYKAATGIQIPDNDKNERYKIQTLEVIRLTGRTRMYDYAILNPWPLDELVFE